MPVEDKSDPPEGSEEAAELRTDTPEGEGEREAAGPLEGHGLGGGGCGGQSWRQIWEAGFLQGAGGVVRPGPTSWNWELIRAPPGVAVSHLPSIPDQEPPQCPDDIAKEKRTSALEPESCEASEPPAKKSKR